MKAPDKIYLTPRINDNSHLCDLWFDKEKPGVCFEYIRKDALLEWAKGEIEKMDDLINKLTSMGYESAR